MDNRRSDGELMAATGDGDMDAFREVVNRYGDRILLFLSRFVGDPDRAADLAQETFLRLYRRLQTPSSGRAPVREGSWTSFLHAIAANLGRDELRRRKVRREVPVPDDFDRPADTDAPPESMERREREATVRAALASLPDDVREILLLRDAQGLEYERIAEILGLRLGTVKSRINRARLAFKDAFLRADTRGRI